MSLCRVLKVLAISTATLAQGSRDVDLSENASDWKQLNITEGNNTLKLQYSMRFPEGRENLEQYASCVTGAIEKDVTKLLNVTDEDINSTQFPCNTTAFFTPKNKSLILNTQVSSLSPEQCELLENMTFLLIYSRCMNQTDQNYYNNTKNRSQHYSAQNSQDNNNYLSDWVIPASVGGGILLFGTITIIMVLTGDDKCCSSEPPTPTSRGRSLK